MLEREIHDHVLRVMRHQPCRSKQTEDSGEQPYRYFVKNAFDMIYMIDAEGRLLFCNPAMIEALGYSEVDLLGESSLRLLSPKNHDEARERFGRAMRGGEAASVYCADLVTKAGKHVSVEIHSRTLYQGDKPVGRIGMTKQRKLERVERELQETIRKLNALQLTRSFGSSLDIREIGLTVTEQLKKVIPLRSLHLYMHKGEIHSCHTFFPDLPGVQLYEERSDLLNREVAEVLDQQKIKCWCQEGEVHIALPLIYNGEAIGVWTVTLTKETYAPEHCQLLDTISDHLSSAIGHSLLFLTERRARAAREYLHSVLQSSRDGICIMRGDGEIRYLNDSIQLLMEMPQVICRDLEIFRQSLAGPIRPKDIARAVEYVLDWSILTTVSCSGSSNARRSVSTRFSTRTSSTRG